MPVSVTFPAPAPSVAVEQTRPATKAQNATKRQRPIGLWKARGTGSRRDRQANSSDTTDEDIDGDEYPLHVLEAAQHSCCGGPIVFRSRKRHRSETPPSDDEEVRYWDYSRRCDSPQPERLTKWTTRSKVMDISTIARGPVPLSEETVYDMEDWRDLKELFAKAAEQYEGDDPAETLLLLRAVIHECHRFLRYHRDPSLLFSPPAPEPVRAPEHNWFHDEQPRYMAPPSERPKRKLPTPPPVEKKCKCVDLVTAFHTILGTVLFFFGNLIRQDPSLALEGEPTSAIPYWLAAMDVFETGENLPTRISGKICSTAPEDWRMAIMWGRTLVALADDLLIRQTKAKEANPNAPLDPFLASYLSDNPKWPDASPFGAINRARPITTRRLSLSTATPNELLVLAMDQFTRGIFHMPHPNHSPPRFPGSSSPASPPEVKKIPDSFSRAKELFTIGSEVLLISEKLLEPTERQTWGAWSDSVFSQMKMEVDMEVWRGPITRARGRCCLIVGAARAEELEGSLEKGDMDVLASEEAEDAREALENAIGYLEKARELGASVDDHEDKEELRSLLVEALVTLANLTVDREKREELYSRAQQEGGEDLELDNMDETL